MIHQKIKKDIVEEFLKIRDGLKIHFEHDFDITAKKHFLQNHVPKEIIHKSKLLLDTLLNYLMEQAVKNLEKQNIEIQNSFFAEDFRKQIREQINKQLQFHSAQIEFSTDPRLTQGLIVGGIIFAIGSVVTVTIFIPTMAIGAIVSGLATIIISAIAFKVNYDKATPKSRNTVKLDIENYLQDAERHISEWIKSTIDLFSQDFNKFCSSKGIEIEERIE